MAAQDPAKSGGGQSSKDQRWDPANYAENARFVSDLGEPVVALLAPAPGERILDLGCGDGELTQSLVAAGAEVVAVDGSAEQVAAARARGLVADVADGMALDFDAEFDAVFSNAALHWMKEPAAVVAGVRRALRPGGRFVAEMGGAGNVGAIEAALSRQLRNRGIDADACNPWYFPTPAEYGGLLTGADFQIEYIELIDRPTPLPGSMAAWLETFAQPFLNAVADDERPRILADTAAALEPKLRDADGKWTADYVRLRFRALLRSVSPLLIAVLWTSTAAQAEKLDIAVLQALDKVTARVSTVAAPVGRVVRFGTLEIIARTCDKRPPEEPPESSAFLDIAEVREGEPTAMVFRGWMFASSPALSAMEHPVYDVRVLDCKRSSSATDASPGESSP